LAAAVKRSLVIIIIIHSATPGHAMCLPVPTCITRAAKQFWNRPSRTKSRPATLRPGSVPRQPFPFFSDSVLSTVHRVSPFLKIQYEVRTGGRTRFDAIEFLGKEWLARDCRKGKVMGQTNREGHLQPQGEPEDSSDDDRNGHILFQVSNIVRWACLRTQAFYSEWARHKRHA